MTAESGDVSARDAVAAIGRGDRTRILAALARRFGDLDLAEDMMQEAFAQALRSWPESGVPDTPQAWLMTVAKRKALDAVRREGVLAQKLAGLRIEEQLRPPSAEFADPASLGLSRASGASGASSEAIADDRLGLIFACTHPALRAEDRIALTLRFVAGLTTPEVANALLVPVTTMQQRLVRAKSRIRKLGISFEAPRMEALGERLGSVQRVVYLIFAEGFARSTGEQHVRDDLTAEAIRLARLLRALMPESGECAGLLALMLLTEARRPARIDGSGRPVSLAEQDRSLWDAALIAEGIGLAEWAARAAGASRAGAASAAVAAGPYAIQAAIAALHAEATDFDSTDWAQIAVLYGLLEAHEPGPVMQLGRAVATGRALGPEQGLRCLDRLAADPVLARFRPFHIARAITLEELGDEAEAIKAYRTALELPGNEAEGDYLAAALAGLDGSPSGSQT